jgi:hypothetical protein
MKMQTHTADGLLLSKWGRITFYAQMELNNILRRLVFVETTNKEELIEQLTELIDTINNE